MHTSSDQLFNHLWGNVLLSKHQMSTQIHCVNHLDCFLSHGNLLWHSKYATDDIVICVTSNQDVQAFLEVWRADTPSQFIWVQLHLELVTKIGVVMRFKEIAHICHFLLICGVQLSPSKLFIQRIWLCTEIFLFILLVWTLLSLPANIAWNRHPVPEWITLTNDTDNALKPHFHYLICFRVLNDSHQSFEQFFLSELLVSVVHMQYLESGN